MNVLLRPLSTSIGSKVVVAITGLLLVGFILGHMAGNLLIFLGRDWLNAYAHHLKSLGIFLWLIRLGLLAVFVIHIVVAIRLNLTNGAARPVGYAHEDTMQASWASRHMVLTGLVLLAFTIYHLAHFTAGAIHTAAGQVDEKSRLKDLSAPKHYLDLTEVHDSHGWSPAPRKNLLKEDLHGEEYRHDVYSMVINGFRDPLTSTTYLIAMAFLGLHLWHGASSMLQTLGLNGRSSSGVVWTIGPVIAAVVVAGNCAIVLAVWLRVIG